MVHTLRHMSNKEIREAKKRIRKAKDNQRKKRKKKRKKAVNEVIPKIEEYIDNVNRPVGFGELKEKLSFSGELLSIAIRKMVDEKY